MDPQVDRDLVVQLTRELIRIPTVNPPGDELPAAEYIGNQMHHFGLEVEMQHLEENRAQVIGRIKGRGAAGHLVYTGHLDVVPPGGQQWEHDPFSADQVDGKIYGRGSADMKGGVAAMVAAAAALTRAGFKPAGDYVIAATAGEEAGMMGAAAMVERTSLTGSEYLLVGEPSNLDVFIGEKGVFWVEITALGRTAHGSMPWLGANAISYISRLIPRLEAYPFAFEESPLLGKPTLSVNVIDGGNKTNVVPDICRIELDMRTVPGQDHASMLETIRTIAAEVASDFHEELRVEPKVFMEAAPLETERENDFVDAVLQSATAVRGIAPAIGGVTYGTDAAHLGPGFDIPMVICGPGAPGMAHQPDECVEVEQLVQAAQIYVDLAMRLLG